MSHSTQIHHDKTNNTRILAIHNGDWSGETLLRVLQDSTDKPYEMIAEFRLPQKALQNLVNAQIRESTTEEEIDLAIRLLALGKCQRPPCPACGDQDQSDPRHHADGTCFGCEEK